MHVRKVSAVVAASLFVGPIIGIHGEFMRPPFEVEELPHIPEGGSFVSNTSYNIYAAVSVVPYDSGSGLTGSDNILSLNLSLKK